VNGWTALVGTVLSGLAALAGAYALVVKAHGETARPAQLLRRLWDWIEGNGLDSDVPPTLANDVREHIADED
jgi:hypothetical protein